MAKFQSKATNNVKQLLMNFCLNYEHLLSDTYTYSIITLFHIEA